MDTQYYCRGQPLKGPPGFLWLFICMNATNMNMFGGIACHVWWQKEIQHFWWYVVTLLVSRLAPSLNAPVTFPLFISADLGWNKWVETSVRGRCYEQFLPDIGKRVCARHSTLSLPVADRPSRLGSRRPLKKIQCRHQRESRCVIILNLNYPAGWKCERQPYLSGVGRRCFILCVQWVPPLTRWD